MIVDEFFLIKFDCFLLTHICIFLVIAYMPSALISALKNFLFSGKAGLTDD